MGYFSLSLKIYQSLDLCSSWSKISQGGIVWHSSGSIVGSSILSITGQKIHDELKSMANWSSTLFKWAINNSLSCFRERKLNWVGVGIRDLGFVWFIPECEVLSDWESWQLGFWSFELSSNWDLFFKCYWSTKRKIHKKRVRKKQVKLLVHPQCQLSTRK